MYFFQMNKSEESRIKCDIKNYFFRKPEMACLGFWVTHNGFSPLNIFVEKINK